MNKIMNVKTDYKLLFKVCFFNILIIVSKQGLNMVVGLRNNRINVYLNIYM